MDQIGMVISRLDSIDRRLDRMERQQESHVNNHERDQAGISAQAVVLENRLTKVEGSVSTRTWLGGVGLVFSALISALSTTMGVKP